MESKELENINLPQLFVVVDQLRLLPKGKFRRIKVLQNGLIFPQKHG